MKKHLSPAVPPMRNPFAKPVKPAHKDNIASLFGILGTITVLLLLVFNFLNTSKVPTSTGALVAIPTITPGHSLSATPGLVSLRGCVTDSEIRIRQGPGTDFEVLGGLVPGTCVQVLGRNQGASWVYIVTEANGAGWVATWLLTIDGDVNGVALRSASND